MPLTDLQIRQLSPSATRYEVWDGKLPGFGVRISPYGHKSFVLLYRHSGRARRITFGRYPVLPLSMARAAALEALTKLARGEDPKPRAVSASSALPFSAAVDQFVELYCKQRNRENTARETERLLKRRFVHRWGDRELVEITKGDVLAVIDGALQQKTPSAANHALAAIRLFFNWCMERGLVENNPCRDLKAPARKKSRDRVLDDEELARVWQAADATGYPFGTFVQLLILTAQRRTEVACMEWSTINFQDCTWSIPAELSKNGAPHHVPLTAVAMHLLESIPRLDDRYLFPSSVANGHPFTNFARPKAQLAIRANVDFTLHDLRRTAATGMAKLSVEPHVIERILNHVSGVLGGVAGVYNRYKYLDQMRHALEAWATHLRTLV